MFGKSIKIKSLDWIIGTVYASETAIDDNSFSMITGIEHWLLGRIYEYNGHFTMLNREG